MDVDVPWLLLKIFSLTSLHISTNKTEDDGTQTVTIVSARSVLYLNIEQPFTQQRLSTVPLPICPLCIQTTCRASPAHACAISRSKIRINMRQPTA